MAEIDSRLAALEKEGPPETTARADWFREGMAALPEGTARQKIQTDFDEYIRQQRQAAIQLLALHLSSRQGSENRTKAVELMLLRDHREEIRALARSIYRNQAFGADPLSLDSMQRWPRPRLLSFIQGCLDDTQEMHHWDLIRVTVLKPEFCGQVDCIPVLLQLMARPRLTAPETQSVRRVIAAMQPVTSPMVELLVAALGAPSSTVRHGVVEDFIDGPNYPLDDLSGNEITAIAVSGFKSSDPVVVEGSLRLARAILAHWPGMQSTIALAAVGCKKRDVVLFLHPHIPRATWNAATAKLDTGYPVLTAAVASDFSNPSAEAQRIAAATAYVILSQAPEEHLALARAALSSRNADLLDYLYPHIAVSVWTEAATHLDAGVVRAIYRDGKQRRALRELMHTAVPRMHHWFDCVRRFLGAT